MGLLANGGSSTGTPCAGEDTAEAHSHVSGCGLARAIDLREPERGLAAERALLEAVGADRDGFARGQWQPGVEVGFLTLRTARCAKPNLKSKSSAQTFEPSIAKIVEAPGVLTGKDGLAPHGSQDGAPGLVAVRSAPGPCKAEVLQSCTSPSKGLFLMSKPDNSHALISSPGAVERLVA